MPIAANLRRRGAVYYWRRRVPVRLVPCLGVEHLVLSLQTRVPTAARYLAAQLDARAEELFMTEHPQQMSKEQLSALFKATYLEHRTKLEQLAAIEMSRPTQPARELEQLERARGEAYLLLASHGAGVQLDYEIEAELRGRGCDTPMIRRIFEELEMLRGDEGLKLSRARLRGHIADTGAVADALAMAMAQPVYLRALGEALISAHERYGASPRPVLPFDELVAELEHPVGGPVPDTGTAPAPAPLDAGEREDKAGTLPNGEVSAPAASPAAGGRIYDARHHTVASIAESLVRRKRRQDNQRWTDKTEAQARYIFWLFDKFLGEECGVQQLHRLQQAHLDAFNEFLMRLPFSFGKAPKDRQLSIADIRKLSARDPKGRTMGDSTRNRHLNFLGQLLTRARAAGVKLDAELSLDEFRSRRRRRARNERPAPSKDVAAAFYQRPVFTGCRDWDEIDEAGSLVFHRAAYFAPMLETYLGLRREEACGLTTTDVIRNPGVPPYVHVRENAIRGLKNPQSHRFIALHPELLRLGFCSYVQRLEVLGYDEVFPDLLSPSSRSPLGDRLYDELQPSFRTSRFGNHLARHFFGNQLKQAGVPAELRADLLGHGGTNETTERYCDAAGLNLQLEAIRKLPVVTAHLETAAVRLLPWVEARQQAPWARATKR